MSYIVLAYFKPEHRRLPAQAGSAAELDALLDRLLVESFEYSLAKMRVADAAEAELDVGVDPDRRVGSLCYRDEAGTWFTRGADSAYRELVYLYLGEEHDYPHDSEISLKSLRSALAEFLELGGRRPTCVNWQPGVPATA